MLQKRVIRSILMDVMSTIIKLPMPENIQLLLACGETLARKLSYGLTTAEKKITFVINKAANPLKIGAKTATVKNSKLKKGPQTLAVTKVIRFTKKINDKKTYTLVSAKKGNKSFKKYFKIKKNTGKVTVKKGLKKGTYKVKVKVKALGNNNYKSSGTKTVTFKVKIK